MDADSLPLKLFALTKEMKGGEKAIVSDDAEIEVDELELALSSSNDEEEEVIIASERFVIFVCDDDDDGFSDDDYYYCFMMGCENE